MRCRCAAIETHRARKGTDDVLLRASQRLSTDSFMTYVGDTDWLKLWARLACCASPRLAYESSHRIASHRIASHRIDDASLLWY